MNINWVNLQSISKFDSIFIIKSKHFYIAFLLLFISFIPAHTQIVIVFDTIQSPWVNTSGVTGVDMETCSRAATAWSGWNEMDPDNTINSVNNLYYIDGTSAANDRCYLIGYDDFLVTDGRFISGLQGYNQFVPGYPIFDMMVEAPYGTENRPVGISADYSGMGYVVGDGLSRYDFIASQVTYLEDLPPEFQAGGQMAFHLGSFYYPNRNHQLIQLKVRDHGTFYRVVGALPDTLNYGGLIAIPRTCDSTDLFIINNNTNETSTFYKINTRVFGLEESCLYDGRPDPGPLGAKGNSLSAIYLNERDYYPCELLLDLQPSQDSTLHLYYEICGGSLPILQDDIFLNLYQEFDSITVELVNAFDGNSESLSATTFQELTLAGADSQNLSFRSLGFAETEHYTGALSSLTYHHAASNPTSGTRIIQITAFHPFHGQVSANVYINVDQSNHAIQVGELFSLPTCFGEDNGSITISPLGGQAPYQIEWQDGSTEESLSDLVADVYDVTIIDSFYCQETFVLNLGEPDSMVVSIIAPTDSICGQSGELISLPLGGAMPYIYDWSSGSSDSISTNLSAGMYSLQVADSNDCMATAEYTLFAIDTIYASEIIESCLGQSVDVNSQSYEQSTIFELLLSTPDGCDSLIDYQLIFHDTFFSANNYTFCSGESIDINGIAYDSDTTLLLTMQTMHGCDSTEQHIIQVVPENNLVVSEDICEGDLFDFNGVLVASSGLYYDTLTAVSGCDSILQLDLTVHPLPTPVIQTSGSLCAGSVRLFSDSFDDYIWSTGEINNETFIQSQGDYGLSVTDEYGCEGEAFISIVDSVLVVDYHIEQPFCPEDNGRLIFDGFSGGNAPYSILETGTVVVPNDMVSNLSEGDYVFTIQDASGCEDEIQANINSGLVVDVLLSNMFNIDLGTSITLDAIPSFIPTSIRWSPSMDLSCEDCLTPVASPKETTNYTLSLESSDGCVWEGSVLVIVKRTGLYIPNAFSPNDDGRNDEFTISISTSVKEVRSVQIYNRWGGLVFESDDNLEQWDGMTDGQQAAQGVYLYKIEWIDWNDQMVIDKGDLILLR